MARSVSIYNVAERAGVSIATVSRVVHSSGRVAQATRERVLAAAAELNWRPNRLARGLAGNGHGALAIVFPDLLGPYFSQIVLGYEEHAVADDRSVLILAAHGKPNVEATVADLATRVDGMVIMDRTVTDELVLAVEANGTPVVLLARPPVQGVPAVRAENEAAATILTAHLIEHGHRDLAFLGDPDAAPDVAERWRGFRRAHRAAGLVPPDKPVRTGFVQDDGYAAVLQLLDGPALPTAMMCANDEAALGAYAACRDRGVSIPTDLAVTGWDDIPAAQVVTPALTTVRQPMRELGGRAGALLTARLSGQTVSSEVLATHVIFRGSCGC